MPVPMVAGNWKMHKTVGEAEALALELRRQLGEIRGVEVAVCPSFVALERVARVLAGSGVMVGAQNMFYQEEGAFTGEVSPRMLRGLCQLVILGHSERRRLFGETDEAVNLKVKSALAHGLRPILCVGETLEERRAGRARRVVEGQLRRALEGVERPDGLVVAYEPVWAIGTGVPADPDTAEEMMSGAVFCTLASLYGEHTALEIPLLYGGSVTPDNIEGFVTRAFIHGALVGGASLRADSFAEIVRKVAEAGMQG